MANKTKIIKPLVKSAIKAQNKTALNIGSKVAPSLLSASQQPIGAQFWKTPIELSVNPIVSRPISMAERLGIPKSMRSNPKALEDPYYWGYNEWNNRYNAAVSAGNVPEIQRLRALHFITKAPNTKVIETTGMPKEVYHGSVGAKFTVFDSSKTRPDYNYSTSTNMFSDNKNVALGYANNDPDKLHSVYLNLQNILERDFKGNPWNGSVNNSGKFQIVPEYGTTYSSKQEAEAALQKLLDQYYPNNPAKQAEQRHYTYVIELMDPPHPERSTNAFSDEIANIPTLDGGIIKNVRDYYDLPRFDENPELYNELTTPHIDYFVKDPRNIKSSAIMTYDNFGRIIPIVKRDNFHNPDVRYKQGGIIKAQNGKVIGWNPSQVLFPKWMFELVAKRSNGAQTKSIPTIIRDVVTGRDKSFYNDNNINGSNEIDTYLYGRPYNSEFTGDVSIGPDYTSYINKNYPNRNIKTYNTHFGDTLYIDNKAKSLVEKQLNNGEVVGGSMGRYAHAPSYIVTKEEGRPYDAGGHLIKFGKDNNGNIVANMSDIYDFLPEDFEEKYNQTENPSWTRRFANNIGTPFIVRQNNIPVRFKEIVPEYKTDWQKELGGFLSQWGNTYDLKLPLSLSDEQIQEIFDGRDYGDDILDFMVSKGYIK